MTMQLGTLIAFYVVLPLAVIMAVWLFDELRVRKRHFVPTRHLMLTCEICLHKFMADKDVPLPKCPQCGSRNRLPDTV